MTARGVFALVLAALPPAAVRAQPEPDPAAQAFVTVTVPRATCFAGEAIDVVVSIGIEPAFLREHLIQTFRQRLDVPVQLEAPWLENLRGAEARGTPPDFAAAATRTAVVNHELARLRPGDEVTRDGRRFATFTLVRRFVVPRAAAITVPATTLRFAWAAAFDENFFGERVPRDSRAAELTAAPLELQVSPLPDAGRPAGFRGAVGTFTLTATLAGVRRVPVGGSLTLVVVIEGQGDLERVPAPEPELPGFHVRGHVEQTTATRRTLTFDLVPLSTDLRAVPAIEWWSFDPGPPPRYRRLATEPIAIEVEPAADGTRRLDPGGPTSAPAADPRPAPGAVEPAAPVPGVDVLFGLAPVARRAGTTAPKTIGADGEPLPWAWLVLALAAPWLHAFALGSYRRHARRRPERQARALRSGARRAFARALAAPGADRQALLGRYVAVQLGCSPAAVIDLDLPARLQQAGVPRELALETEVTLDALAAERFGGGVAGADDRSLTALVERLDAALVASRARAAAVPVPVLVLALAAWFAGAGVLAAQDRTPDPVPDPEQAARAFADGDVVGATEGFLAALRSGGWDEAALLYDLGNCAHALGRPAEAILWYRRALAVAPGDVRAAANLRLVQRQLGLLAPAERTLAATLLARALTWLASIPAGVWLAVAVLLQLLGWTGWLLHRRRAWSAVALATGLVLGVAVAVTAAAPRGQEAVVLRDDARVRSEPHDDLGIVATLEAGETVHVLASSPRWSRVRRGGDVGWTETANLAKVAFEPQALPAGHPR